MIKRYLLSINTIYLISEQLLLYIILLNSLIKLKMLITSTLKIIIAEKINNDH